MKICIAQTESIKGKISKNIQNHLKFIERAIVLNADLIIFPELSITAYEPDIAKEHSTTADDPIFNPFHELANKNNISIGVGMPINASGGITISMLIFQPEEAPTIYSKQMLHVDEEPYFVCGNKQAFIKLNEKKIAIGICYETLQRMHFLNAKQHGADIYIASVAKPQGGIEKAYKHYPSIASEFKTPIVMANCIGFCDNFLSVGQSAVWNKNGKLVGQLNDQHQGMLIYDTDLGTVDSFTLA